MQDNEKKPALRFKGFTDPWEQRKLGEMVDVCSGMDYKHLSEGDIPVYGTGGYMLSVNKALSYDRNAVGIGRKGTIDKPYILKAPFWTVDTLFYAIPKDSKNIDFTFDVFQKVDWKKKDESTGVPSLSKIAINETSISTPSKLEQERIGSFFRNLDTLITLHQRKYEKLVNIKKSMLDKMFPQNGASVPEIRFKSFTDPWEQRKLDEIANFSKGVGYSKNDLCEEGTPIILYGRLYTKYETSIFDVDTFVKEKAGSVYSKGGEVIVPASGETAEDISIASVVVKPGILLGGDLNIVSPTTEYDSAFLALTISSGAAHEYLSSLAQGKSVVHLHNADIQSVSAKFPTKREQEKIHLLFGKIDTLITLHQRKLEKLQNIKKSCLEKMFV